MTEITVEKLRDSTVYDREGAKVGSVGRVFLEPKTESPNFFTVKTSAGEHLIPVASAELDKGKLQVPFDKDTIKGAPSFDLDEGLETSNQDELVEYYESTEAAEPKSSKSSKTSKKSARQADAEDEASDTDEDAEGEVEEQSSMILRAEQLEVGTEWEETGEARLRKRVVTRTETVEVPLAREELVIEREPLSDDEAREGGDLGEAEEVIVLREERAVVDKEVVGVEKVTVAKRTLTETETISADVQEEKIDIDNGAADDDRS